MPGRTARASVSTTATRSTRVSKTTRPSSSSDVEAPEDTADSSLRRAMCSLFYDAQKNTAGHRKLVVSLRKLQEACAYEPTTATGRKSGNEFDEEEFNAEFTRCVLRVLPVRKSEGAADKVVRFMTSFLRFATEKDRELIPEDEEEELLETPTTRLTAGILGIAQPLLLAKDKFVRYRATQIIRHVISSLESIDDEVYHLLRSGLMKRVRDKEAMIRVQAVLGLVQLLANEEGAEKDDDEEEDMGLLEKLLDVLQNDPSADVRKSLLLNLPLTPATLPFLLERARDLDPATRRALYSKLLPGLGDFRHLSLSMREKLLRWGLRDRDDNVQKATARLFREHWIEDIAGAGIPADQSKPGQPAPANVDSLLELMERIDIVNSGGSNGIALPAFKEFWAGRPDYLDAVSFQDPFWDNLTAESVFMVRSFNDFCRQNESRYGDLLEEKLPEVTKLAFMLERYSNKLIETLRRPDHTDEDIIEPEFIIEQLLYVAETLDYSDEIGRRKMFGLLREMIATAELPEEVTKLAVGVLRGVCGDDMKGERDFCGVVLEAIAEVHDTIADPEESMEDPDESFHSARSVVSEVAPLKPAIKPMIKDTTDEEDQEKVIKEIMVNMKCLHIAQCMLQNVEGHLQANVHLVTMLNNLVIPAVRSHEAPIRERGLQCLGLCCLLDQHLAEENLSLFIHCLAKGNPELQVHALETLCDIVSVHPPLLAPKPPSTPQPGATVATTEEAVESTHLKPLLKAFSRALRPTMELTVVSAAVACLAKLFLTRALIDDALLQQMALTFFDPSTQDNYAAKQALSYFLPAFCQSRRENMEAMGRVACDVLKGLVSMHDELEEDEDGKEGMVGLNTAAIMLADFTDARKLVVIGEAAPQQDFLDDSEKKEEKMVDSDVHLDLLAEALERALTKGAEKEYRKALLMLVGKLVVTPGSSQEKLLSAKELLSEALDGKLETSTKNALTKLQASVEKALEPAEPEKKRRTRKSIAPLKQSIEVDESVAEVDAVEMSSIEENDDTATIKAEDDAVGDTQSHTDADDSIVDELLDGEDTIMEDS